jgi:hypothetical protein
MRYYSIFMIFVSFMSLHGQTYETKMIIDKADSILKLRVGDRLHQYFKYDTNSYYEYKGFNNKSHWKALIKSKKTKGKFINTDVRFYLDYPLIKGISGTTHIVFDSNLNLADSLYLDFIPDFLFHNTDCNFISNESVLKIASDSLKEKGLYDVKPYLNYDNQRKRYVYEINNTLTNQKDAFGNSHGDMEVLIIDAITKEILYHKINWYGPVY